jgi:hypothetical protein
MMGGAEQAAHDLGQTVQPVRCDATCALATKLGRGMGAWPCERQSGTRDLFVCSFFYYAPLAGAP